MQISQVHDEAKAVWMLFADGTAIFEIRSYGKRKLSAIRKDIPTVDVKACRPLTQSG